MEHSIGIIGIIGAAIFVVVALILIIRFAYKRQHERTRELARAEYWASLGAGLDDCLTSYEECGEVSLHSFEKLTSTLWGLGLIRAFDKSPSFQVQKDGGNALTIRDENRIVALLLSSGRLKAANGYKDFSLDNPDDSITVVAVIESAFAEKIADARIRISVIPLRSVSAQF